MQALSNALKTILNGLAMQYVGDYLSEEDKKANLANALAKAAEIEKTVKQESQTPSSASLFITLTK